jgi:hypothetical protein
MNDKQFTKVSFIGLGLFLLWWLIQRKKNGGSVDVPMEGPAVDPNTLVYSTDPSAFNPANLGNVNITIANQGLAYLGSNYIPLFGFVGMAQGVFYG